MNAIRLEWLQKLIVIIFLFLDFVSRNVSSRLILTYISVYDEIFGQSKSLEIKLTQFSLYLSLLLSVIQDVKDVSVG